MNTDKQLLFKDLTARLPYNVICYNTSLDCNTTLSCHLLEQIMTNGNIYIKPFLRPMSSMTEEEEKEYNLLCYNCQEQDSVDYNITELDRTQLIYVIDWLNAHHFDYRGLIEKGLALEAPKGMYNI